MNGRLRLAVTGRPIIHSKSPEIFRRIFKRDSVNGFYTRIAADSIEDVIRCSEIISIDGINVTSPFKEHAFKASGTRSMRAEFLNASNTLCFREDEKSSAERINADNTDPEGVFHSVMRRFADPSGLKAVVIGAGGAGAAAAYALSEAGFDTVMVNRTVEKAVRKTDGIKNCRAEALENINNTVKDASLIIHTLPVADYFFNADMLMEGAVLFDANYKYSPLKKAAAQRSLAYIDGREWLIGQAEAAYRIFRTGSGLPDATEADLYNSGGTEKAASAVSSCNTSGLNKTGERNINRAGLLSAEGSISSASSELLKNADSIFSSSLCMSNISLIGFMGCGKSAAGRKLSEITGYEFIDTDSVIETRAGMSISEMFETKGEAYFRNMERDVVTGILSSGRHQIISCGGGVVGDSIIREKLKQFSLPVWLLASPEVSLSRITDNSRPLLDTENRMEKAVKLFNKRIDLYGAVSELVINTETGDAEKTAGRIYEEISEFL